VRLLGKSLCPFQILNGTDQPQVVSILADTVTARLVELALGNMRQAVLDRDPLA